MTERDRTVCDNMGLVHACARRFIGRGVEYEDLVRDYELTAFSKVGSMNRESSFDFSGDTVVTQEKAFTALYEVMMEYYGTESGKLSDAIASYLITECGITADQIDSIRIILLSD